MPTPSPRVLVCDDDRSVRAALTVNLSKAGYHVVLAERVDEALERLRDEPFDVLLSDVKMPGRSGLDLLHEARTHWPETQVVLMTGFGNVADAVAAMKAGAHDYLIKPIARDELLLLLERALRDRALHREVTQLRRDVDSRYGFESLVGTTDAMQEVYEQVAAVADSSTLC